VGRIDYDIICDSYDELYRCEQFVKYSAALSYLQGLNDLILDIGCGTGLFYDYLSDRISISRFEYFGVDKSFRMLEKAKEKSCLNIHLIMACAEFMPFRNHVFSYIFSFTVFHEVDMGRALREVSRLGLRGCYVVISIFKKVKAKDFELLSMCKRYGVELVEKIDEENLKDFIFVFRVR